MKTMKNLKQASFFMVFFCMIFLSSCYSQKCPVTDASGHQVYDANGNALTYDCSGSANQGNKQTNVVSSYAFLPFNDINGKFAAENCNLYSDFGISSQSNTDYFGANSEGDGIIDFFVSGGVKIKCREIAVDFTGDGYVDGRDVIRINGSEYYGPVLTSDQVYSLVNGNAPAGFTLITLNGVRGYSFRVVQKSIPVAYSGMNKDTGRGAGQPYYIRTVD